MKHHTLTGLMCAVLFFACLFGETFAANRYWVGGTANWDGIAGAKWALTSGGAGGEAVPTSSDDVFFDANSGAVNVKMGRSDVPTDVNCSNLNLTGFTGSLSEYGQFVGINLYGNLTLTSTTNWNVFSTLTFKGTSGTQIITSAGKSFVQNFSINSSSTVQVADDLNVLGFVLRKGTFDANDKNIQVRNFLTYSADIKVLNMGSGTWSSVYSYLSLDFSITTGLTLNCETSTIKFSGTDSTQNFLIGGGQTFYNIWNATNSGGCLVIDGSNTFNNFRADANSITKFTDGTDQTVSFVTLDGTAGNLITITGTSTAGWTISDSAGTNTVDYCTISYSNATGGATWNASNSTDGGNNTGWNFTTRYWVGGTADWDGTAGTKWAYTSGGVGGAPVPTATDDVFFDGNSGGGTVTAIGGLSYCLNLDFTGYIGTFAMSSDVHIYGNLTASSSMAFSVGNANFNFLATSGSYTVTSNGNTFGNGLNFYGAGATWTLQDDLATAYSINLGEGI
ncbi:MAG: hypothetical protein AAB071_02210, partial [Bacteroidota bacterium]